MVERLFRKGLVLGIILLFIGVLSSVSSANDTSEIKETVEENNDSGDWGFGFILCWATYTHVGGRTIYPLSREKVECIDLETGNVIKQGTTGLFGFYLFKFLPLGRDYKLTISTEDGSDSFIVSKLGLFEYVHLWFILLY
jgi:hypothetical protein